MEMEMFWRNMHHPCHQHSKSRRLRSSSKSTGEYTGGDQKRLDSHLISRKVQRKQVIPTQFFHARRALDLLRVLAVASNELKGPNPHWARLLAQNHHGYLGLPAL